MPFNIGLRAANGDIIVLQNPECLHVHDILTYFSKTVDDSNYISISAYGMDEDSTNKLPSLFNDNFIEYFEKIHKDNRNIVYNRWYNHSTYPTYYHYCSAMTKSNIKKLNGFDERYAYGFACDDDEFVMRIRRLGLKLILCDQLSVIHQYHNSKWYLTEICMKKIKHYYTE